MSFLDKFNEYQELDARIRETSAQLEEWRETRRKMRKELRAEVSDTVEVPAAVIDAVFSKRTYQIWGVDRDVSEEGMWGTILKGGYVIVPSKDSKNVIVDLEHWDTDCGHNHPILGIEVLELEGFHLLWERTEEQ